MKRIFFFLLPCFLNADPNFILKNASDRPLHVIATGANDLMGLRDGAVFQALIHTLQPGQTFEQTLSLQGILHKGPHLDIYADAQGKQPSLPISVTHVDVGTIALAMPIGSEQVYEFTQGKKIFVEWCQVESSTNNREFMLRSCQEAEDCVRQEDIHRGTPFERLNQWSLQHENQKEYQEFQEQVYTFVYDLIKAGSITRYFWQHPFTGLPTALKMWWTHKTMERSLGASFAPPEQLAAYERWLPTRERQS